MLYEFVCKDPVRSLNPSGKIHYFLSSLCKPADLETFLSFATLEYGRIVRIDDTSFLNHLASWSVALRQMPSYSATSTIPFVQCFGGREEIPPRNKWKAVCREKRKKGGKWSRDAWLADRPFITTIFIFGTDGVNITCQVILNYLVIRKIIGQMQHRSIESKNERIYLEQSSDVIMYKHYEARLPKSNPYSPSLMGINFRKDGNYVPWLKSFSKRPLDWTANEWCIYEIHGIEL